MLKYINVRRCNICGEARREKIYKLKLQNLVKCSKCKLIYLDLQRIDIKHLYDEGYYKTDRENSKANFSDYTYQEKVVKKKFMFAYSHILKNFSKNAKLLDIGSGYGYFLKYLPKGIVSYAVEASRKAFDEIKINNPNSTTYNKDFIELSLRIKFDFITSFDVIEHQVDLKKYLIKVHSLLNKDGAFMFTTPDYGTIFNRLFGVHAPTIQPLYHNYYFDKNWIKNNLSKFGFKIVYLNIVYFETMNVGSILLYLTLAFPFLKHIPLINIAQYFKIDSLAIPFLRFGGIECIVKKLGTL